MAARQPSRASERYCSSRSLRRVLLPAWIDEALAADLPGLTGLTGALDAVTAGLTLRWSSGGTEGAVNRIKKIKGSYSGVPSSTCSGR
ncbi:hypothetical protein [Streptomyces tailanensis]|uniref:hypothetical protein n=1 Tax=Streptomyces tailanensis TaxID=2569858 RepID=UPI001C0F15EF|nr:hypothetical protein [Streptomyces tailanensis]